ncbi:MAG: DNA primase [Candidatus Paceibacterota bacterium]|jgi:DNA primase
MSSRAVEQIKERLPVVDIISSYIKLDRAGANFKGKCPFHNEKTPSFLVSPDRGSYYCFGCGAKGDIFSFVQEFEKVDFKEALSLLADRAGVTLEKYVNDESKKEDNEKDRLRKIMEDATSFFEEEFRQDDKSLDYLLSRGLEDKTIREWRIGSTKKGWNNLYDHLKGLGYSDSEIEKAGLAKKGNHGFYDRFRSRIIFPIFDPAGKVIAFTGRHKEWEVEEEVVPAKYLNSPDTILFDKSKTLYGFHKAKQVISKWKFWILVEGQMDLLLCHQAGFGNAIATSGTALTRQQLEMLSRFSKNLLIAYDGDKAGVEAARRAWILALSLSIDVKMARMPEGSDPADVIAKDVSLFREAIKGGTHIVEFYLNVLLSRGIAGRELGKKVENEILPYVKAIESAIDQAHFISLISAKTGIKEETLFEALKKTNASFPAPEAQVSSGNNILSKNEVSRGDSLRKLIAGAYVLLKQEDKAREYIGDIDLIRDELLFTVEEWLSKSKQSAEDYLADLLVSFGKEKLHREFEDTMKKFLLAEQAGDIEKAKALLQLSDDMRKKLSEYS